MKTVHLIVNPNAGIKRARRFLPEMISAFNRAGYLCAVWITEKRGDAVTFAREHAGGADLVVACGGDGTLNEVITGLQLGRHVTPLGYIPCGSTNDFASPPASACRPIPWKPAIPFFPVPRRCWT